ncbi:ThiF family adenylyltransferase [Candidatus Poribacteria bacterium]
MAHRIELRMSASIWKGFLADVRKRKPDETIGLMLVKPVAGINKRVYIASRLIIPSDEEAVRHQTLVKPDKDFLRAFYTWLKTDHIFELGYRVVAIHSHPFCSGSVGFSTTDHASLRADWRAIATEFDEDVEFLSMVVNQDGSCFDGYMICSDGIQSISKISVIDETLNVVFREEPKELLNRELYSRMLLIPDLDLGKVSKLDIGVVGLGGLGSCIVSDLAMLGIAEEGTLVLVDPDTIEVSNLSRIDYATFDDIGRPKVDVARDYIQRARPGRQVITFQQKCFDREVLQALACCDATVGGLDRVAPRSVLNDLGSNFMVPYLDAGAGVVIDQLMGREFVTSGGQVRLFVPGINPCLHCTLGLDQSAIEAEWTKMRLTDQDVETMRQTGYLQNFLAMDAPQPSVYNLNQMVGAMTATTLLSYILSGVDYHFASLDLEKMEILKGTSESNKLCPYCGEDNCIGNAELFDLEKHLAPVPFEDIPIPGDSRHIVEIQ